MQKKMPKLIGVSIFAKVVAANIARATRPYTCLLYTSVAYSLAQRKHLSGKNDYEKLVRFLATKGYSFSIASSVAKKILDKNATSE